jgi:glycosyltransferase involved in cell wall biosynthesis
MTTTGIILRNFKGLSGAVNYTAELARRLPSYGFSVSILALRGDPALAESCGAKLIKVPSLPFGGALGRRAFSASAGYFSRGLDLVHGQGDTLRQDVLSLHNCVHAAHQAVHGSPLPASDAVGRLHAAQLGGRKFRRLVANSGMMKTELSSRFAIPADLIKVVYPGMNPARFAAPAKDLREEFGFSKQHVVAGLITSGDLVKRGASSFLKALALASGRTPELKGLIVASPPQAGPLKAQAAELGLSGSVVFTPPSPQVERLYATIDFMAYPALYEEFGIVVLEACASGLPVLLRAPRVGAAEIFTPELRAELNFSGEEELAAKMTMLASDPVRCGRLGAAARACAAPVTWDAAAKAVAEVYQEVLSERPPR